MKTVLFVCVENAGRSQMAKAFLDKLGEGKVIGLSAGTMPAASLNPVVVQAMGEVGIDLSRTNPQPLTQDQLDKADRIITMGCGVEGLCPAVFLPVEDWNLEDPKGQPLEKVREIRDRIKERVIELLNEPS